MSEPAEVPVTLERPTSARLLEGVLTLGREIHLGMDERALAERFLRALVDLFPGRHIAVRLADPRTQERQLVASPGARLSAWALRGPLVLKRSALEKSGLSPEVVTSGRVRVVDVMEPVYDGVAGSFSVPLVAGGEIYGLLDFAYPAQAGSVTAVLNEDEQTLIPIANHLSVALRNVRLHSETGLLRDMLGKLIEHADALIIGVDRDWRVTVFNRALVRLTGFQPGDVIGRDLRDWLPPGERSRLTSVIVDALAGQPTTAVDIELATLPGGTVRTMWNVAAISNRHIVEAVVAVGQDLTRIRSLERQVIQAEKLATLGELAAGVVHELNNPLTSIIVYADYLLKKTDREGGGEGSDADKLRRILEGAERILNFSRSLVQYARPSSGELDVVSLNDVVRQSLSFCEHIIRKSDARLDCELAPELPPLYAVRGQVQQVVINLVTNALHALPAKEGRVRVTTAVTLEGNVAVSVEDNGGGIRAEDHDRIFEPFYTTKVDGKGTGLGLSIVRNIVDAHRGTVKLDSAPGRTRFTVTLPTKH
jgi:two-component system, NtrC family, sensor kinase